jgi:hypothetical protein
MLVLWTQRADSSSSSHFTLKTASVEKMFVGMANIADTHMSISRLSHSDFEAVKKLFSALEGVLRWKMFFSVFSDCCCMLLLQALWMICLLWCMM